jgi:DNA gyrase subunit A
VRFDEATARAMGRTSQGVRGIRLRADDRVVGMVVVDNAAADVFLLTACENGYGKRTPLADYPIKGRGGLGVINIQARPGSRNGAVIGMRLCRDADDIMYITEGGMIVRSPVADTRPMGRNVQGVRMINLKEGDRLVAVEIVARKDLEDYGLVDNGGEGPAELGNDGLGAEEPAFEDPPPSDGADDE